MLFMTMTTTATTAALAYNTWCGVDACLRGCSRNKPLASLSLCSTPLASYRICIPPPLPVTYSLANPGALATQTTSHSTHTKMPKDDNKHTLLLAVAATAATAGALAGPLSSLLHRAYTQHRHKRHTRFTLGTGCVDKGGREGRREDGSEDGSSGVRAGCFGKQCPSSAQARPPSRSRSTLIG